jgi:hypothetical protein
MTPSAGTRAVPFGNDPAKIARYQTFWNRNSVPRPLLVDSRDPRGLFLNLNIMVENIAADDSLRRIIGM